MIPNEQKLFGLIDPNSRAQIIPDESEFKSKLNLGCGVDYLEGYVNADIREDIKADVRFDIDSYANWPFKDRQFDLVYCSHVLEHIHKVNWFKSECGRILQPDGKLVVVVPDYTSPDAWGDPTHVRAYSYQSFMPDWWPGFGLVGWSHIEVEYDNDKGHVRWIVAAMQRMGENK